MEIKSSVSLVLAGYNEEPNVEKAIQEAISVMEGNFSNWELILVDDGSLDGTAEIMRKYSKQDNIRFLPNIVNLNFGTSVLRGLYASTCKYAIYNALDLPLKLSDIPDLIRQMEEENLDCMILERVGYNPTLWRKITSIGNSFLLKILYPKLSKGTPVLNFIQIYRTDILKEIRPLARSPIFVWPELIFRVKQKGMKWKNCQVPCYAETGRKGAFGKPHDIIWGVYEMLRFKVRNKK